MNDSTANSKRKSHVKRAGLVWILSLYYALSLGMNYGISNQNAYLLAPWRLVDPTLWERDWLVTQVGVPHSLFAWVAAPLLWISPEGWALALTNLLVVSVICWVMYRILILYVSKDSAMLAFVFLIGLLGLWETQSVSDSYMYTGYLQPSTLGACAFLGATALFLYKRYALSGLVLAIGGLFHVLYLILGIAVFVMAHLYQGRTQLLRRITQQCTLPLLALIPFLYVLSQVAVEGARYDALREKLLNVRVPHHHSPSTFKFQFLPLFGWLLLGIGVYRTHLLNFVSKDTWKHTASLQLSLLSMIVVGTFLTTAIYFAKVAQAQPWRIAPYLELLCIVPLCAASAQACRDEWADLSPLTLLCFGVGLVLLAVGAGARIALLVALLLLPILYPHFHARSIGVSLGVLVFFLGMGIPFKRGWKKSTLVHGLPQEQEQLFDWVRAQTPKDAVFLTPPTFTPFRLHAKRAIVVDWKTHPVTGKLLQEWFTRLEAVSGLPDIVSATELIEGYNRMTVNRLRDIHAQYASQFAVLFKQQVAPEILVEFPVLFQNKDFVVVDIQ